MLWRFLGINYIKNIKKSLRNKYDMSNMACPDKYKKLGDFYKYYSGQVKAPVLTIFIGGNHEASNYLSELFKF